MQDPYWIRQKLPELAIISALALMYVVFGDLAAALFGYRFGCPVWPPSGIALAAGILFGGRVWPGVFAGGFILALLWLPRVEPISPPILGLASLALAGAATLEMLAGTWVTKRFAGGRSAFEQPQTVLVFAGLAGVLATLLNPALGVATLRLAGIPIRNLAHTFFDWWLGDVVSTVVLTPLIVVWVTRPVPSFKAGRTVEYAVVVTALILLGELVFGRWPLYHAGEALAVLFIPVFLWSALRFGPRGTATATFVLATLSVTATLQGRGPFAPAGADAGLVLLQNFVAMVGIMSLVLAADVTQRRSIQDHLQASEQRYRALFEHNPLPMWVIDCDTLRFLAANEAAVQHYGFSREEFLQMRTVDLRPSHQATAPPKAAEYAALQTLRENPDGENKERPTRCGDKELGSDTVEVRHQRKDGSLIEVELVRHNIIFDGRRAAVLLSNDVTERNRVHQRLAAFSELGRRLSTARTAKEAARTIADTADRLFGWDACLLDLCGDAPRAFQPVILFDVVDGKRQEVEPQAKQPGPISLKALQSGPQLILRKAGDIERSPASFGDTSRQSVSIMCVPLRQDQRNIGVFSIQSYRENAYSQADLAVLQALADHCGGALERIRAEADLLKSREETRFIADALPVLIAYIDADERYRFNNQSYYDWFGFSREELYGKKLREVVGDPTYNQLSRHVTAVLSGQRQQFEHTAPRKGFGLRDVEVLYLPDKNGSGKVDGFYVLISDITERKRSAQEVLQLNAELEARVRDRTAQLEAINKELEAFAYSVSHDLRAPLRSIRGFSEVLIERYASKLDARGREFLQRSSESSQHMDKLIDDLLKLSRVSRSEFHPRTVDLSAIAESIASELGRAEPQRKVEWLIGRGLKAQGDERLLRIVMDNLLRNAWKFTSKRPLARIELGLAETPNRAFFVRDNGAGFDMNYAGKLFGVFQRLHSTSEFPGTGVGLATVQRIINRHGGRLWAKGVVEEGATFYFSLPDPVSF